MSPVFLKTSLTGGIVVGDYGGALSGEDER